MADLSQVQIDFTYRDIHKWDLETTRKNYKDPVIRPLIDEVIRRHKEQVAAPVAPTVTDPAKAEAVKLEAEKRQALLDEQVRLSKLTPAEQQAEMVQRAADQKMREQQSEKAKVRAQMESQKLADYLSCTGERFESPKARAEEMARRMKEHEDKIAAEEAAVEAAEAERVAAEAKAAEDAKAAADATAATAAQAEADRVAAEAAVEAAKKADEEKARLAAEEAAKPKQKIVREYQVRDRVTGQPIGKPTRLVADTWEEMSQKQEEAHAEAVRYAERMKKRVTASTEPTLESKIPSALTDEDRAKIQADLESKDENKKILAQIRIEKDDLDRAKRAKWITEENKRQSDESLAFMKARPEYFACEANGKLINEYLKEKNLSWTAANLEEAYEVVESKLAENPNKVVPAADPEVPSASDEAARAAAAVEAAKAADAAKAEADAKAAADVEARTKLEAEIRTKILAEIEANKKIEQEKAAVNPVAPQASVAPAAPAAGSTPVETTTTVANPAAVAPKLPAGGIEPGSMHGGRPVASSTGSKAPVYTKQDIKRMSPEEMKKKMRDPKFVRIVNDLFAPQK